jgi:hypothetical protein
MWTPENRVRYDRSKQRYPSDLTDSEWTLVEPLIPPAKRGSSACGRVWHNLSDDYHLSTGNGRV